MGIFSLIQVSASEEPLRLERHLLGQSRALGDFPGAQAPKASLSATDPKNLILVHVIDETTRTTVGGMAVQLRKSGALLPVETNLGDPELDREIASFPNQDVCEVCGTWIDKDYRKRGLVPYLYYGSIAAAALAGAKQNFSMAHEKAAAAYEKLGVTIRHGKVYPWPNQAYRTYVARVVIEEYLSRQTVHAHRTRAVVRQFRENKAFRFRVEEDLQPPLAVRAGGVS